MVWTRGTNGRRTVDEESGRALSGGWEAKRKTETEMGGRWEERFGRIGRGERENDRRSGDGDREMTNNNVTCSSGRCDDRSHCVL